jgi:hypothetical protein
VNVEKKQEKESDMRSSIIVPSDLPLLPHMKLVIVI